MRNGNKNKPSFKNPITYIIQKIGDEPAPFLFFGSLIGLKIYHFVNEIGYTADFISIMYDIDHSLTGIKAIIFSKDILNSVYTISAILFDAIIIFSYLIRVKPHGDQGKAQGFWEKWYPLVTVLLPMVAFTYFLYKPFSIESDPIFYNLYQSPVFANSVMTAGLVFSLVGCILSIVALLKLKSSFSLRVEVRRLVTTGMYRYMRHPLYFSELIHAFGTTLLLLNSITIPIYIIFFTMEVVRAKFEEKKFLEMIPEYADYKARTGFLFPRFRQKSYQTP